MEKQGPLSLGKSFQLNYVVQLDYCSQIARYVLHDKRHITTSTIYNALFPQLLTSRASLGLDRKLYIPIIAHG